MNFSPQRLADESRFTGSVTHVYGENCQAFDGIGGAQLGVRARQDASPSSHTKKQLLTSKL